MMTDAEFRDAIKTLDSVCEGHDALVQRPEMKKAWSVGPDHPLCKVQHALEISMEDAYKRAIRAIGRGKSRTLGNTRYSVVRKLYPNGKNWHWDLSRETAGHSAQPSRA